MSLDLNKIPRWALIALLTVTLPVVGWALNTHVSQVAKNTADIQELARIAASLTEATANLKEVQKVQSEEQRLIRQDTNDLLRQLYRLQKDKVR